MTGIYCTVCGKEFEEYEDVIILSTGSVIDCCPNRGDYAAVTCDTDPFLGVVCKDCHNRPNRVVIEVRDNVVSAVRAERPSEIVAVVRDYDLGHFFNRQEPVQKLGTVEADFELAQAQDDELTQVWAEERFLEEERGNDELLVVELKSALAQDLDWQWLEQLERDEEDYRARQEELELHYQGMGGVIYGPSV